ncbi:MAG: hypothetical protein JSV26_05750 [bacterium]|nr:MAG: hypothetical protein JSV26_05750 [bacterium]
MPHRVVAAVGSALGLCLLMGAMDPALARDYALTVYGGRVTKDKWTETLSTDVRFADAWIMVGALAWTMARSPGGALSLEIEGQVAKHSGDQEHWEFNLPVIGRWRKFPWSEAVDTSIAFGLGPSWATEEPEVEKMYNDSTQKFLVYWLLEVAVGPPDAGWAVVFRLHHRSDAFGVIAEDGGSNTLTAGMKFRF